jgi:hypothetical protein
MTGSRQILQMLFGIFECGVLASLLFFWRTGRAPDTGHDPLADATMGILLVCWLGMIPVTVRLTKTDRRLSVIGFLTVAGVVVIAAMSGKH